MNRLTIVSLLWLPLVIVACASPAVPTIAPTVSPTLAKLPTETTEPTLQPNPVPPEIPVPYTIITPTRVVTLTVTEITETITTRGKAAVIWVNDKDDLTVYTKRLQLGLLDIRNGSITVLTHSLQMNSELPIDVLWSPDGARLILHGQISLSAYDIIGVQLDAKFETQKLYTQPWGGFRCSWPFTDDGRYLMCSYGSHGEPPDFIVHDSVSWRVICEDVWMINKTCPYLPLADGRWWQPRFGIREDSQRPPTVSTMQASSVINDRYTSQIEDDQVRVFDAAYQSGITYILPGAKILNVTWSPLK